MKHSMKTKIASIAMAAAMATAMAVPTFAATPTYSFNPQQAITRAEQVTRANADKLRNDALSKAWDIHAANTTTKDALNGTVRPFEYQDVQGKFDPKTGKTTYTNIHGTQKVTFKDAAQEWANVFGLNNIQ